MKAHTQAVPLHVSFIRSQSKVNIIVKQLQDSKLNDISARD